MKTAEKIFVIGLVLVFVGVLSISSTPSVKANPDSITYNGSTLITVLGYSQTTPCTFTDVYNADVAGGWGVVTANSSLTQFTFNVGLRIGNNTTETWFADTKKSIYMLYNDDYGAQWAITVARNGHLRFGTCVAGTYATSDGCMLFGDGAVGTFLNCTTPNTTASPKVELYSSTISSLYLQTQYIVGDNENTKIYNCIFVNMYMGFKSGTIYNVYCSGGGILDPMRDLNLVTERNSVYGIYLRYVPTLTVRNVVMSDIQAGDTGYDFYIWPSSGAITAYAIDTTCGWSTYFYSAGTSALYRQYSFNLKVVENDNVGSPVTGATVTLYDNNLNLLFTETTADNGWIAENVITHTKYMQSSTTTYYPFTLEVSKTGYQTIRIIDNFDQIRRNWTVSLLPTIMVDGRWWYGSGTPSNGTGNDGDFYWDNSDNNVFLRMGGAWSQISSLAGGATGPQGPQGIPGTPGENGMGYVGVVIRKNNGENLGPFYGRLNLIEGTNMLINIENVPADNEYRITFTSSGGGAEYAGIVIRKNNGENLGPYYGRINLIESDNIMISVENVPENGEYRLTITSTGVGGSGGGIQSQGDNGETAVGVALVFGLFGGICGSILIYKKLSVEEDEFGLRYVGGQNIERGQRETASQD